MFSSSSNIISNSSSIILDSSSITNSSNTSWMYCIKSIV